LSVSTKNKLKKRNSRPVELFTDSLSSTMISCSQGDMTNSIKQHGFENGNISYTKKKKEASENNTCVNTSKGGKII